MNKILNPRIIYLLISLILSIVVSNQYLNKFENNLFKDGNREYSSIFQNDSLRYIKEAEKIRIDIINSKNFLVSGGAYKFSFLYPRIIYFFNKIVNQNQSMVGDDLIELKNYKIFIFFQIFIFFLSLIFFFKILSKTLEKRLSLIIISVLFLNPIIFQFHLSLLTESLFLSFLIFSVSFLLKSKNTFHFFLLGIFIGILYMLRTIALLYPIVFLIYLLFEKKKISQKVINGLSLISGLIIVLFLIGVHNYLRAGVFYSTPLQAKIDLETYIVPSILVKSKNFTELQLKNHWEQRYKKIITNNNFDLTKEFTELQPREYLIKRAQKILDNDNFDLTKEREMILFFNKLRNESINTISENKIIFFKIIIKNYYHSILLNPVQVYFDSKYDSWHDYKNSIDHKFWLKIRIIIALLFFSVSLFGFIISIKKINYQLNIFLFFSILYFFFTSCWLVGNTRYFIPSTMFMGIYFSFALDNIYQSINTKIKSTYP